MEIGVIDVGEWQTTVDMRDTELVESEHPRVELAREVCAQHPFPGDLSSDAIRWVADTALDLNARYAPDFCLLGYANAYLQSMYASSDDQQRRAVIADVFAEIERFVAGTGCDPIIVGTGGLMPFQGYVDVIDLDGMVLAGGMNVRFAGLNEPSARDLEVVKARRGIERVLSREKFREEFGGCEQFYQAFPDYLLVAEAGYVFHAPNTGSRPLHLVPRADKSIPLRAAVDEVESLTGVADMVLARLAQRKVALIVIEGIGCDDFPAPYRPISNRLHWLCYTMSPDQYLALTSGKHFVEYPYPPGYRFELSDGPGALYPYSGVFQYLPETTIGRRFAGRSVAVGNRSIMTHLASGADITVECFARSLYNHGVMAVVRV